MPAVIALAALGGLGDLPLRARHQKLPQQPEYMPVELAPELAERYAKRKAKREARRQRNRGT